MDAQENEFEMPFDPYRVCLAIGHIGYTPTTAICDILDNSVSAGAKSISIKLVLKDGVGSTRKNNVKEYVVIDDGCGMNFLKAKDALKLGSSDENYAIDSLSKFGLGLKSAGLSQGERIELISFKEGEEPFKLVLDIAIIKDRKKYVLVKEQIDSDDKSYIDKFLKDKTSGTIVRIKRIHENNHPSVKQTEEDLAIRLGVVYYYFLAKKGLKILLNEKEIVPVDPLFIDEIDQHDGELDDHHWDGQSVKWIQKPVAFIIDADKKISVTFEATQLPHPPSFGENRKAIRDKYLIQAGNQGFYVYRNGRLISWGDKLNGIIPADQDYFAFRGRILIQSDSDEVLNIDVKKSRVLLSDEARGIIERISGEYKRKTSTAWKHRAAEIDKLAQRDPKTAADERIGIIKFPEVLPGENDDKKTEEETKTRVKKETATRPATPKEKGEVEAAGQRVFLVERLDEDALWDRAYHSSEGTIVRINEQHRFIKQIYNAYSDDPKMVLVLSTLFYCLAAAEGYSIKYLQEYKVEDLEKIFKKFRSVASSFIYKATVDALEKVTED